jgi:hypothetical protein
MADMYGRIQQRDATRNSDGGAVQWRMLRGGEGVTSDWIQALILEGLGYSVQFGAADVAGPGPGTFGAGVIDLDEFDMLMTLPAGNTVAVVPIYWRPVYEAIGTIAAVQGLLCSGSGGIIGANSIAPTKPNMHDLSSNVSAVTVAALGDDGGTVIVVNKYIHRFGGTHLTGVAGTGQTLAPEWSARAHGNAPVVAGASKQIAAFTGGQAGTGFHHFQWLELPLAAV